MSGKDLERCATDHRRPTRLKSAGNRWKSRARDSNEENGFLISSLDVFAIPARVNERASRDIEFSFCAA